MKQGVLANLYQIDKQIGKGGQGTVYLGRSLLDPTNRALAIKIIPLNPQTQTLALQEIAAIKTVSNPNCIPYVACAVDTFYDPTTNNAVIVMEYVNGPTIAEYVYPLRANPTPANVNLLTIINKQLLRIMLVALRFIHNNNMLHNDIKPANIVVSQDKIPVLVDFGISCYVNQAVNQVCSLPYGKIIGNCCNTNAGTSIFMPPEVLKNVRYPSSDSWSLGAMIYTLITGVNVWGINVRDYTVESLMQEVVNKLQNGTIPNQLNSNDAALNTVVNSFLLLDPSQRMSLDEAYQILS